MATLKHAHRYVRYDRKKGLYRCEDPECYHTINKKMLHSKACTCPCGIKFILTYEHLKLARPKCLECSNTAKAKEFKKGKELVGSLLGPLLES